jgi:hypothetical protein
MTLMDSKSNEFDKNKNVKWNREVCTSECFTWKGDIQVKCYILDKKVYERGAYADTFGLAKRC